MEELDISIKAKTKTNVEFKNIMLRKYENLSDEKINKYYNLYLKKRNEYIESRYDAIQKFEYSDEEISKQTIAINKLIDELLKEKLIEIEVFANKLINSLEFDSSDKEVLKKNYKTFLYGGESIEYWYEEYKNDYNQMHPPKIKKNTHKYEKIEKPFLKYPFKSKISKFEINNMVVVDTEVMIPDFKLKSLKPLYRPTYSHEPYCWEIDILFINHPYKDIILQQYLVCINVNTRFLNVFPIKNKSKDEIQKALALLIKNNTVKSIKGDGEKSFASKDLKTFYTQNNIKTYFSKSPFTYHNKMVDSVIRTIRNAFGFDNYNIANIDLMKQMVKYYNNTYHNSIKMTPKEMNNNIDFEWQYIRKMDSLLKQVLTLQKKKGLHYYRNGNILMIHIDNAKTSKKFEKQRRNFNEMAEFIKYKNGNVVCKLLKSKESIEIPIMYTKYVSDDIDSIPETYKEYFVLRNI